MDGVTEVTATAAAVPRPITGSEPAPPDSQTSEEPMITDEPPNETAEHTSQDPSPSQTPEESLYQAQIEIAKSDLSRRLDISMDEIEVREARAVVWPDASLGCPQPGIGYAQVLQEGLLIRLQAGGDMYFYHSGGAEKPFLCAQTSGMVPQVTPKFDEMVPPPDSEID